MKWALFGVLLLYGFIHFMGVAKAFNLAELSELKLPISPAMGVFWGVAGATLLSAAVLMWTPVQMWWVVAIGGVLLSQIVVFYAWSDARFGTAANVLVLAGSLYLGWFIER